MYSKNMFDFSVDKQMFLCYSSTTGAERVFRTYGLISFGKEIGRQADHR